MRLVRTLALLAAALPLLGGCRRSVTGSGTLKTEERAVPAFTTMSAAGAFKVQVTIGLDRSVVVTADDNVLPLIKVEVKNDRLEVFTTGSFDTKQAPLVSVKTPELLGFSSSGATSAELEGASGDELRLSLSGAGDLTARGKVTQLLLDASGAGRLALRELTAQSIEVHVSGAASVDLFATGTIKGTASGAAQITWGGDATVAIDNTGVGQIKKH